MSENYITISDKHADLLLACADGTAALLYLHIRRHGSFCAAEAAAELRCTQAEIARAAKTLERLGLLDAAPADKARPLAKPLPENRLPEYQAKDITVRTQSDGAFSGIVAEAENTLGRVLNSNDLKILFGIYDHLGLPADVIMLLLHHCVVLGGHGDPDARQRGGAHPPPPGTAGTGRAGHGFAADPRP